MTTERKQALVRLVSELDGLLARLDDMIHEEEREIKQERRRLDTLSRGLVDTSDLDSLIEAADKIQSARDQLDNITF